MFTIVTLPLPRSGPANLVLSATLRPRSTPRYARSPVGRLSGSPCRQVWECSPSQAAHRVRFSLRMLVVLWASRVPLPEPQFVLQRRCASELRVLRRATEGYRRRAALVWRPA